MDLEGECWIIWLESLLRAPASLSPPEVARFQWRPTDDPLPAADVELSLAGFLLKGGSFEETFIPAGPGQLSVLFGRNGTGKSLALSAVEQALQAFHRGALERDPGSVRPWCTILLQAEAQEDAARLFAQVLAHLGWGPDGSSKLPFAAREACQQALPAWNSGSARPADASGLTAARLADLPLAQLRETVIDAVTASMPDSPGARVIAEAIFSSPVLAVSPDWHVGLAFIPGKPDPALEQAAIEYLAVLEASDSDVVADGLHQAILPWIWQLAGERPSAPVPLAVANLAHAGEWSGERSPESGWPQLGQVLADGVLRSIPQPVSFAPGQTTLRPGDAAAEDAILLLLDHLLEPAQDTPQGDLAHPIARHIAHAVRLAELIEQEANRLVPRFVASAGAIKVRIAHPGEWHARRAMVTFTGGISGEVGIDSLPSGLRTWTLAAISFAAARLKAASWTGADAPMGDFSWQPGHADAIYGSGSWTAKRNAFRRSEPASLKPAIPAAPKVVYLLDEPEAHLHLTAQRDVTATATALADSSYGVLAATHSLQFLDARSALAKVLTLDASNGKVQPSSWTGLADLAQHAEALGIPPSALALACRGVLIVEGPHDKEVINRYGGIDLDKERIVIVPLQGIEGAAGIAELEFLHSLRIPIHVLPDHVKADAIRDITAGKARSGLTKEEQELRSLHEALAKLQNSRKQGRVQVNVLAFRHIDIIRAVPEQEISWALQQLRKPPFTGWDGLDERARAERRKSGQTFKKTFEQVTGAQVGDVIRCLIRGKRHGPRSPELYGLLSQLLAYDPDADPRPGITTTS